MLPRFTPLFLWASIFPWSFTSAQGDPNALACQTLSYVISACASLTPGFTAFTNFNFQAPCLCYASKYWYPDGYDSWLGSCYAGYKTGNPSVYSSFTASIHGAPNTTPCHQAGNVLSLTQFTGPVSAIIPPLSVPTITNTACQKLNAAAAYCNSRTPGFSTLTDFKIEASCYCYSGILWSPNAYDEQWGSCVQYVSSASPSVYSSALSAGLPVLTVTPCAAVGDVLDARKSSTSSMGAGGGTTSTTTMTIAQAGSTPSAVVPSATVTVTVTPKPNGAMGVISGLGSRIGLLVMIAFVVIL